MLIESACQAILCVIYSQQQQHHHHRPPFLSVSGPCSSHACLDVSQFSVVVLFSASNAPFTAHHCINTAAEFSSWWWHQQQHRMLLLLLLLSLALNVGCNLIALLFGTSDQLGNSLSGAAVADAGAGNSIYSLHRHKNNGSSFRCRLFVVVAG